MSGSHAGPTVFTPTISNKNVTVCRSGGMWGGPFNALKDLLSAVKKRSQSHSSVRFFTLEDFLIHAPSTVARCYKSFFEWKYGVRGNM